MTLTTFLDSSMVEHAAVNRGVVGSSPTRGANLKIGRLSSENLFCFSGAYSSAVEPPAHNRLVPGSIPGGPTKSSWPVGQAVKTPPFHGGIGGSIPPRVTNPGRLAQPGERLPYKQDVGGSIPSPPTNEIKD